MWKKAEKFLLSDKYIGPLIKKYSPCRIRKQSKFKYFEALVDAICSQQLLGKAAATIFGRVKNGLGKITPENILKTADKKFRGWGLSRAKTLYVKDLAKRTMNNELRTMDLDKLPDEEVIKELVSVKGIGRWTSEMFLMFSLARPDVFPVDDLGIRNGMEKLLKKELKADKLAKFSLRWKPFRTVASWYLWRSLENK